MAVALVVAAGSGERLEAGRPKAFVALAGRPLLDWSLDALRAAEVQDVVVAVPRGPHTAPWAAPPGVLVVPGGATRSASVRAALGAVALADCAVAAAPVTDTIKEADVHGVVTATLDRSRLWAIQTPQAFRRGALERALDVDDAVLAAATDDAWLVERAGGSVRVVESTPANIKVTTRHDLRVAETLLADRLPRPPAA